MTQTRKPKPPDKGVPPEHKPSRKVALEEVMRTLQDLVSNELSTEPASPSATTPLATTRTGKTAPEEKPPAARPAFSADRLTTAPAAAAPAAEPEPDGEDRQSPPPALDGFPDIVDELPALDAEPLATLAVPPPAPASIPPGGLQQDLPYLEAPPEPDTNLPSPPPDTAEAELTASRPEVLPVESAQTDNPVAAADEINWDDFPILEEAVELAEDAGMHEMMPTVDDTPSTTLPPADAARRLAVQVAARLNVELRKSGQNGLSSDIITRLARLLQEALAKGTSNVENDRH